MVSFPCDYGWSDVCSIVCGRPGPGCPVTLLASPTRIPCSLIPPPFQLLYSKLYSLLMERGHLEVPNILPPPSPSQPTPPLATGAGLVALLPGQPGERLCSPGPRGSERLPGCRKEGSQDQPEQRGQPHVQHLVMVSPQLDTLKLTLSYFKLTIILSIAQFAGLVVLMKCKGNGIGLSGQPFRLQVPNTFNISFFLVYFSSLFLFQI